MPRISKAKIVFFIIMIEAIISLSFFNLYAATPQRPWYSETPNPRHIANNDRLTAEYFNNQLNVIYNWAQRTNTELDNLLHNGIGVASLTVGILNCTNKIINPEWDNLLHNGNGVASITANLVKAQDLEIANSIDVPAIEFSGRSQPTPPVNNGMLYFDSDLQRFRVYQEDGWRDLSSNYIINGTTLTNPLVIDGYLDTRNIYINENASISKNLNVQGNINSSGTTTVTSLNTEKVLKVPTSASTTLGVGSIYYDTTAGKLKAYNGTSWDIVGKDITVDSAMSSTSTNPVQNKVIYNKIYTLNTNMLASLSAGLDAAEASASVLVNNASSSLNTQFNDVIIGFDNSIKAYVSEKLGSGTSDLHVRSLDAELALKLPLVGSSRLGLGSIYYDPFKNRVRVYVDNSDDVFIDKDIKIKTGSHDGTIKVEEDDGVNFSTYEVAVKGLGSAAYANVASFTPQSSSTAPSNPSVGQIYFDLALNTLRYWNGSSWVNIATDPLYVVTHMLNLDVYESGSVQRSAEVLWKKTRRYPYGSEEPQYFETFGEITAKSGHSYAIIELNHKLDTAYEYSFNVTLSNCDVCSISKANDPIALSNRGYQVPSDKTVFVVSFGIYQSMNNAMVPYTNGAVANFCIKGFVLDENN